MAKKPAQNKKRNELIRKITKLLDDHALDTGDALIACFYKPSAFTTTGEFVGSNVLPPAIAKSIADIRQKRIEYAEDFQQKQLTALAEAGFILVA